MATEQTAAPDGLVRPRRRVISNQTSVAIGADVRRNYPVADGSVFNNFRELKNDMISPEYAQEIIEEVAVVANLDMSNPKAMLYFEEVIFEFYIMNAASQKTGYDKVLDIYGVEFDFMLLLNTLVLHAVTPRRFTRALAGRILKHIRKPEKEDLRSDIVSMHSLSDPDHAMLAFDGSTHAPNIGSERRQVANMLANRGIYENMASVKAAAEHVTYDGRIHNHGTRAGTLHSSNPE